MKTTFFEALFLVVLVVFIFSRVAGQRLSLCWLYRFRWWAPLRSSRC